MPTASSRPLPGDGRREGRANKDFFGRDPHGWRCRRRDRVDIGWFGGGPCAKRSRRGAARAAQPATSSQISLRRRNQGVIGGL
jgi:hypothetical protein